MTTENNNIILLEKNQDSTKSNRFMHNFPTAQTYNNAKIALTNMSIFNQFFNIKQIFNNNSIILIFNAEAPITHIINIDDGYYGIELLNLIIENYCFANNLYLNDTATGKVVYFFNIHTNEPQYKIQIDCYVIPTATQATEGGLTKPNGATWNFPTIQQTGQIVIPTVGYGKLIGFNPDSYPSTVLNADYSVLGQKSPRIEPISSILIGCNFLNSRYSNPSNIMQAIKIDASYGSSIVYQAGMLNYANIQNATYTGLEIILYDDQMNDLTIRDSDIIISMSIQETHK